MKSQNVRIKDVDYIIVRKFYTFEKLKTTSIINKNESCNSKNLKCCKCKKVYIGSTQTLNKKVSLHRSNIRLPEIRKLNVSKHLYG